MDLNFILQVALTFVALASIIFEARFDKAPTEAGKTPEELEVAQTERTKKRITRMFGIAALIITLGLIVNAHLKNEEKEAANKIKEARSQQENKEQKAELAAYQSTVEENQKEAIAQSNRLEQAQADLIESQKQNLELSSSLLDVQTRGLHQLTRIGLDRMLTGIEISYKPTAQEWKGIVELYRTLVPTNGEPSYYESPIIATRAGAYWRIDFEEVSSKEGRKWFAPVFTDDLRYRAFEQILQRASLPLWITWGTGAQTFLEPMRGDYPSEIRLSPEMFSFTLRPPLLELNLDSLRANSLITLRSRRRWADLTFHSLDPAVKLDQTLHLKCDRAKMAQDVNLISIKERLHSFTCGSHRLQMTFKISGR